MNAYFEEMFSIQGLSEDRIRELGPYPYFDLYWEEKSRIPYFIRQDDDIVGFALVCLGASNQIAEFCVVQDARRNGLGRKAATEVLQNHPGLWEIAVMEENKNAIRFWERVIDSLTCGNFRESWSERHPKGPKFTFSV